MNTPFIVCPVFLNKWKEKCLQSTSSTECAFEVDLLPLVSMTVCIVQASFMCFSKLSSIGVLELSTSLRSIVQNVVAIYGSRFPHDVFTPHPVTLMIPLACGVLRAEPSTCLIERSGINSH